MNNGWIKLHRKILDSPKSQDSEFMWVWINFLLMASHKEREVDFGGEIITLKTGQFITSRKSISKKTGVQESKVERIITRLKTGQQIEQQTSNRSRLISVLKWNLYQNTEQLNEQQMNNKRTTDEQQMNTNKNIKKEKKEKKEFTKPTVQEIESFAKNKNMVGADCEYFWNFYENKDWKTGNTKMKDWKLAFQNAFKKGWVIIEGNKINGQSLDFKEKFKQQMSKQE